MEENLNEEKNSCMYTFYSAKKLYLSKTPSKFLLIEKKHDTNESRVLSLISRNTVIISSRNGILLFPSNR